MKYRKKNLDFNTIYNEKRITTSHYGLYKLGYTCATMVITMSSDYVNMSKSIKIIF